MRADERQILREMHLRNRRLTHSVPLLLMRYCVAFLLIGFLDAAVASCTIYIDNAALASEETQDGSLSSEASVVMVDEADFLETTTIAFDGFGLFAEFDKSSSNTREPVAGHPETGGKTWHGFVKDPDHIGFATFFLSTNGQWTGLFSVDDSSYRLSTRQSGEVVVTKTLFADFQPEEEIDDASVRLWNRMGRLSGLEEPVLNEDGEIDGEMAPDAPLPDDPVVIEVLFVVTEWAVCWSAGLRPDCDAEANTDPIVRDLLVQEALTTNAMQAVGVNVAVRIAAISFEDTGFAGVPNRVTMIRMALPFGRLSNLKALHEEVGADLIMLIVGPSASSNCGLSIGLGAPWSITRVDCFSGYTLIHELGHNLGCDHDVDNARSPIWFGRGYQDEVRGFRAVMSYSCRLRFCRRIPYFSTPNANCDFAECPDGALGAPIGNRTTDNARVIRLTARRVSRFNGKWWWWNLPKG